jgi:SAM-dependent methyltransferase
VSSGPGKTISAGEYARRHEEDSGFEAICAAARQNCVIRFLRKFTPTSILEVGTGPWSLSSRVRREGLIFDSWVIVEPAEAFAKAERARLAGDDRFVQVDGFVELERETIRACCQDGFDAVIVSGVIHETRHPEALLESAISLLKTGGRMLVNSPNALSFHR